MISVVVREIGQGYVEVKIASSESIINVGVLDEKEKKELINDLASGIMDMTN